MQNEEFSTYFDLVEHNQKDAHNKIHYEVFKLNEIIEYSINKVNDDQVLHLDKFTSEIKAILVQTNEIIKLVENNFNISNLFPKYNYDLPISGKRFE